MYLFYEHLHAQTHTSIHLFIYIDISNVKLVFITEK
jgi:hypothetical protein